MKKKALLWLLLLPLLIISLWALSPSTTYASLSSGGGEQSILAARATNTPYHPNTATPLPAIYKVEQYHPVMIIGAGILVFIILAGVLAFSWHRP